MCTVHPSAPASAKQREQHAGVVDHEVTVEEEVGVLAQRLHDRRPDREVRDVVAVHAVDVEEIGIVGDAGDVGREVREIGGQDRGRDLHAPEATSPLAVRVKLSTNMPSVCASDGQQDRAAAELAPRRGRRRFGDELGEGSRAPTRRPRASPRATTCTPRRRGDRRASPRRPRPRAGPVATRRGRARRSGCTRQRASGRRRSTPSPLHGASSRTRSNAPSRTPGCRPSATIGDDGVAHADAFRGARRRCAPARDAGRRRRRRPRRPCARPPRSPCRPARTRCRARGRRAAGRGRRRSPDSPGPAAWPGPRRSRAARRDRRCAATAARRARAFPAARRRPRRRSSAVIASVVRAQRVDAQRDRRRRVVELERGDRVVEPELVDERPHDPIGMRRAQRDRLDVAPFGQRERRTLARQRAQHAVHEAPGARCRRPRPSPPPPRARARRSTAGTRRGAARRAPADRANRSPGSRPPRA